LRKGRIVGVGGSAVRVGKIREVAIPRLF